MSGVISRGVRAPIIREGDDIVSIVADSVERAMSEDGFELYNNDVALFEQDPGEPVFGCNFERVEHIEWKDRRQLGALLTSLEKKHVLYVEEDPHDGNGIWYCHKVLKALAA